MAVKFLRYKPIVLGDFTAHQFTLFESKHLFSIIFYYFKGEGWQDRFHTHAFKAISLRIFGTYIEEWLIEPLKLDEWLFTHSETRRDRWRFFPKDRYHRLGYSGGCLTMLLAGPWDRTWKELRESMRTERTLTWGRKSL